MPGNISYSKDVVDIFLDVCGDNALFSVMRQYTPPKNCEVKEISRPLNDDEYNEVVGYALMCGIENIFTQEEGSVSESFIPAFDYEGVLKDGIK